MDDLDNAILDIAIDLSSANLSIKSAHDKLNDLGHLPVDTIYRIDKIQRTIKELVCSIHELHSLT